MSSKRQRHESEYSLVTLSAVAAAKSIAESKSNNTQTSTQPQKTVKKVAKSNNKGDQNQLHPMYGVQPFIAKLYQMINSCDRDTPRIASWDDNGHTFVVKDTKAFASEIMPNYMQTKQFDSFIRNLNFYDFHKIQPPPIPKSDRDPGAAKHVKYRHPNFQRGKMDLVREIKRSTRKVRNAAAQQEKEVEQLKSQVKKLEGTIEEMLDSFFRMEEKVARLESLVQPQLLHPSNQKDSITQPSNTNSTIRTNQFSSFPENTSTTASKEINLISSLSKSNGTLKQSNTFTMPRTVSVDSNSTSTSIMKGVSNKREVQQFDSEEINETREGSIGKKRDRDGKDLQNSAVIVREKFGNQEISRFY